MSETEELTLSPTPGTCHCPCQNNTSEFYKLDFGNRDILEEVIPVAIPPLLQVLNDSDLNREIIKEVMVRHILNQNELRSGSSTPAPSSPVSSTESSGFTIGNRTLNGEHRQPLIPSDSKKGKEAPQKHCVQKLLRKRYLALVAFAFLCGITVASIVGFILWAAVVKNSSISVGEFHSTCFPFNPIGYQVVRSLDEYNKLVTDNTTEKLFVAVQINEPSDWPVNSFIQSSDNVKELYITGPSHGKKIIDLVASSKSLKKLTINNYCNKICSESLQEITALRNQKVHFSSSQLIVENFQSSCASLLQIVNDKLMMNQLEEFSFYRGSINHATMVHIERILSRSLNTLTRIEFLNTTTDLKQFGSRSQVYSSVTSIVYDVTGTNIHSVPIAFCTRFPSLQHLSLGNKLRHWNDITNIFDCQMLKTLDFKLAMPREQTNFNVSFLHEQFPRLESAEMSLIFPKCANGRNNSYHLLGSSTLPEMLLYNIGITSNCNLVHL